MKAITAKEAQLEVAHPNDRGNLELANFAPSLKPEFR
jgi:hypothetical protein